MKDLKDIAKGIAIGIMLGLVIVFGFVIASLTGCSEAERLMPPPVATEEEATLEPTEEPAEDPAVKAGLRRHGPGDDTVPKGYIPANVGPDGSIVLADYWEATFGYKTENPRIAMNPNLKHIRVYPVVESRDDGLGYRELIYGELTTYTLLEAAMVFQLVLCQVDEVPIAAEDRGACIPFTQEQWDAFDEERKAQEKAQENEW